ncbi:MAG: inverse autotransporter beta domain-containing protein, partial [Candidatus Omnitrophica bacterium]|nr:inverse autotransporter beta domain-containing protein [Candidatus Omnitrophota bacterium]
CAVLSVWTAAHALSGTQASAAEEVPASVEVGRWDLLRYAGQMGASMTQSFFGANPPDWIRRLHYGLQIQEDLKPGYFVETVAPLYHDPEFNDTVFVQPRAGYDGTDNDLYNLGLGWRRYSPDLDALLGVNFFGDYQRDPGYGRAGVGGEILGSWYDVRVNGYFRVGPARRVEENEYAVIYEQAVSGMDAEFGMAVPYMPWAKVYGGGQFYDFKKDSNLYGWHGRLELKPAPYVVMNLSINDDNMSDNIEWRFDVRMNLDFEEPVPAFRIFSGEAFPQTESDPRERALERVERENRILKERYAKSKTTGFTFGVGKA